eukprot:CAMPEP_0119418630 /NCGR_PEP_ID=MMETSP1335-20130426/18737_1 /TAXON_ID=259385 /ORGANISM="Chrysoculter rhomboideus, Strain RCC1486" /LENGTH=38 /DNA_ID= /DNA_START= /DNA_END= /DNA_ORIENTATION=
MMPSAAAVVVVVDERWALEVLQKPFQALRGAHRRKNET